MSRPIVTGFVFGLVILIIVGEIPGLLGIPAPSGEVYERIWTIVSQLSEADATTIAIGLGSLAILFVGARLLPQVPWALVVLVLAIGASTYWDLAASGVVTIGAVPNGLPPIGLPGIALDDVPPVIFGGLAIAMVGLAEGLSAARLFAAKDNYAIDTNQELLAVGAANLAAGVSGGMGVGGSLSKTAAAHRSGGSTQVTGLTAAVLVMLVILALASLLEPLPRAALSAIVIQAVWSLMDVRSMRRYLAIRRNDFTSALAALVGVLLLGPLYGLLVAVGLAVLGLVYRSSRVETDVMGKLPDEKAAWGSITDHPERRTVDGVMVVRLDVPLFWANANEIHDRLLAMVEADPATRIVLLDLEATSQLDTTSIDLLEQLLVTLRNRGVDLYLVRVFHRARVTLAKADFIDRLGEGHMWHSISAAVRAAKAGVAAVDESDIIVHDPGDGHGDDTTRHRPSGAE